MVKQAASYTETLKPAQIQVLNRLAAFTLEYKDADDGWNQKRAEQLLWDACELHKEDRSKDYVYHEIAAAGTTCNISVKVESEGTWRTKSDVDVDGNEWGNYKLVFQTSWPSHGTCDIATGLARLAFYQRCTLFAAELQAQFYRVLKHMERSKAQIDEYNTKAEARRVQGAIRMIVESNCKGLRVKGFQQVPASLEGQVPDGDYTVDHDKKAYKLDVNKGVGFVTRIS